MNIDSADWDPQLLELFEVPGAILPRIGPSSGVLGHTRGVAGLPDGIPISGVAGDQQAALFGQACFAPGDAKCTYGTGSFIVMNTGSQRVLSGSGLLTTVAWQLGEGSAAGVCAGGRGLYLWRGGAVAARWSGHYQNALPMSRPWRGRSTITAAWNSCPPLRDWGRRTGRPHARGTITGLTRGSGRGHIARATLDAMALQNADILRAMERDLGKRMRPLRVDGGAAANDLLMQIQADVLGRKLIRPRVIETTVAGACYLAGLGVGLWRGQADVRRIWQAEREFSPLHDRARPSPAARLMAQRRAAHPAAGLSRRWARLYRFANPP